MPGSDHLAFTPPQTPAEPQPNPQQEPQGLSQVEAHQRLVQYGYNELPEKRVNALLKILAYFWGPIAWMIEAAMILSALVHRWEDFVIIGVLLIGNAAVGSWEEFKAGHAIEALKATLAVRARVKREGQWTIVSARELVPGDLIRIRIGDIIPADARLLEGDPLEIDQSILTGESLPVTRRTGESAYSGSIVRQGEIDAVVTATGRNTYFGKTAQLVESAQTRSHFQLAVLKIGNYLIVIAMVLVAIILVFAVFVRGDKFRTVLQFALVLAVAAIPAAMPTVLSVTMAVGARILAAKQAIVRRLAAIEEVAGIDVLCCDKTGTLTMNELKLGDPFSIPGIDPKEVILCAALASRSEDQDPIDMAILRGAADQNISNYKITHFQPFDPVQKRTEASVQSPDGKTFRTSKGAVQVIVGMALNADEVKKRADDTVAKFATRGFRSLGVARADGNGPWRLIGILPLYDPARPDSKATIDTAREMGINVKMVTGDQIAIAREISRQLGLGERILDAAKFTGKASDTSGGLAAALEQADGFAQVFPEHKYRLVETLQEQGHIVGMTGDGVNDAPALKKADAGIAVAGATDAARAAADIVLTSPGLSVIIDAVKESRRSFERMNAYSIYRIGETIRVLLLMTLSILIFNFYPVTAAMIVLLALLNDGAILSIAYDHARYSHHPEAWNMRRVLGVASALGVIGVVASFGLFYLSERAFHLSRDVIQTLMYLKLSVAGHLNIFVARTRGPFWSFRPANILILAVGGTQLLATLISVYGFLMMPIGWKWALLVWGYALAWLLVNDRVKLLAYRLFSSEHSA